MLDNARLCNNDMGRYILVVFQIEVTKQKMNHMEMDIRDEIGKKILALPPSKAVQAEAILRQIQRMKEEGKDESNLEMFEQAVELAMLLNGK